MSWGNLVVCIIFILVGIWVKFFPDTISGINMMTQEQKDKFDLKKYSTMLCKSLIWLGIIVGPGYYLLYWIGLHYIANHLILWGVPVLLIVMIIYYLRCQLLDKK